MIHSKKYDYYKFPGGGIEPDETWENALIREVLEESGLVVEPESIRPFGQVHRIQKGDWEDVFIQDNYYYLCDAREELQPQHLDAYEEEEGFTLEYVTPAKVIATNQKEAPEGADGIMMAREIRMMEILVQEGYLEMGTK